MSKWICPPPYPKEAYKIREKSCLTLYIIYTIVETVICIIFVVNINNMCRKLLELYFDDMIIDDNVLYNTVVK